MSPVSSGVAIYADKDAVAPEIDDRGVRMTVVGARPDDQRGPPVHLPDLGGHPAVLVLLGDEGVEVVQGALAGGAVHQDIDLPLVKDKGYLTPFTGNVTRAAYPDVGEVGPAPRRVAWPRDRG